MARSRAKTSLGDRPLVELASTHLGAESDADRATVAVHVDADVLAGAAGAPELEDGDTICAETARRLACDARWYVVLENFLRALDEAEATFQAIVDPYARADFFLAFSPEGVEIEEGFLTLTSLPGGLLAKVGKFKQQVGKVNTLHPHFLPWVDKPLMVDNLFGGSEGLADSGISVSKLILNPWVFLEATGEIYKGDSGIFTSHKRSDVSWVGRLRGYRDVTESTNVDVGASYTSGTNELGSDFRTQLYGIDATVRYRPLRAVPLYTSVGGAESDEFRRQNRLIAKTWDHCFRRDIPMPGFHHLSVVEQMGDGDSALCGGALRMMNV